MNRPRIETGKQAEALVTDGDLLKDISIKEGVGALGLVIKGGITRNDRRS